MDEKEGGNHQPCPQQPQPQRGPIRHETSQRGHRLSRQHQFGGRPASMSPRSSPKPYFSQSHFRHQQPAGGPQGPPHPLHTTLGQQQRQLRQQSPQQQPPQQQRQPSPQPAPQHQQQPKSAEEKAFDIINGVINDAKTLETEVNGFQGVKADKQFKYLEEMLTRSLLKLDGVESGRLDNVKTARKKAVKVVNTMLDLLELKAVAAAVPTDNLHVPLTSDDPPKTCTLSTNCTVPVAPFISPPSHSTLQSTSPPLTRNPPHATSSTQTKIHTPPHATSSSQTTSTHSPPRKGRKRMSYYELKTKYESVSKKSRRQAKVISELLNKPLDFSDPTLKDQIIDHVFRNDSNDGPFSLKSFFKKQVLLIDTKPTGRRYDDSQIDIAMTLFFASPKCYRILTRLFALPSISTLRRKLGRIQIYPGFNDQIIKALGEKVALMGKNSNLVSLVFDEMTLKKFLSYHVVRDEVEGTEDFGTFSKTDKVCDHALVFMVRGITTHWKEPVGYFLSSGPTEHDMLTRLLVQCIELLTAVGLKVKCITSDQGSSNQSMYARNLKLTKNNPYFEHKGEKIWAFFDIPHLLKSVRNNLKNDGYKTEDGMVLWKYIQDFFDFDNERELKMAPKLTNLHMDLPSFAKMNVKLAAQVFSHSVASGMDFVSELFYCEGEDPSEATQKFIKTMDNLFDCFNSKTVHSSKKYLRPIRKDSGHVEFLKETLQWFETIKPLNPKNKDQTLPCLEGWKLSIQSLLGLWNDLSENHGVKYLLTNRLQQDMVENLFSQIRGNRSGVDRPTAQQFRGLIKKAMVQNLLIEQPNGSNCELDGATFLLKLDQLSTCNLTSNPDEGMDILPQNSRLEVAKCNLQSESLLSTNIVHKSASSAADEDPCFDPDADLADRNICTYIAGFLAKKIKPITCESCKKVLIAQRGFSNEDQLFLNKKQYTDLDKGGLTVPSKELSDFVIDLESVFDKSKKSGFSLFGVKQKLIQDMEQRPVMKITDCAVCNVEEIIIETFCTLRLKHNLKLTNRALSDKVKDKKSKKQQKLARIQSV